MNNPQAIALADSFAQRLAEFEGGSMERLTHAYQLAFSRSPTGQELAAIRSFWMDFPNKVATGASNASQQHKEKAQKMALTAFCQALLASAEFRYLN